LEATPQNVKVQIKKKGKPRWIHINRCKPGKVHPTEEEVPEVVQVQRKQRVAPIPPPDEEDTVIDPISDSEEEQPMPVQQKPTYNLRSRQIPKILTVPSHESQVESSHPEK